MSFFRSSGFTFRGNPTINSVSGDQYNVTQHICSDIAQKQSTEYDQFRTVIRGDIHRLKDLHEYTFSGCKRVIFTAELLLTKMKKSKSKVTVFSYKGPAAHEMWETDFKEYSQRQSVNTFQLFGINRSDIPSLIFYDELIPIAQAFSGRKIDFWLGLYLAHVLADDDWKEEQYFEELDDEDRRCAYWQQLKHAYGRIGDQCMSDRWINSRTKEICDGPYGPEFKFRLFTYDAAPLSVPLTIDMLAEGIPLRYFCTRGSEVDDSVLMHVISRNRMLPLEEVGASHEEIISSLPWATLDAVHHPSSLSGGLASSSEDYLNVEWHSGVGVGLSNATPFLGGVTRFRFERSEWPPEILGCSPQSESSVIELSKQWLAQAHKVFTALDISAKDWERCLLVTIDDHISLTENGDDALVSFKRRLNSGFEISQDVLQFLDALASNDSDKEASIDEPAIDEKPVEAIDEEDKDPQTADSDQPPIFLFIHPVPLAFPKLLLWTKNSHYWSFDEDGSTEIPEEMYEGLGIVKLKPKYSIKIMRWPTHSYDAIREWQVARGYDPTTADFAKSLGYPEIQMAKPSSSPPAKDDDRGTSAVHENEKPYYVAVPDMDILAFGF